MKPALLALLAAAGLAHGATPQYTITDLGAIGDAAGDVFPSAINASGQVAGSTDYQGSASKHAARWSPEGGSPADLGVLGTDTNSQGYGINDAGTVAGSSGPLPVLAPVGGAMASLGTLADTNKIEFLPGDNQAKALDINNLGQVVGVSNEMGNTEQAFYWTKAAGMAALKPLAGGHRPKVAAINDSGLAVGVSKGTALPDGNSHAVLWGADKTKEPADLGALPTLAAYSESTAINNPGQVVGYCSFVTSSTEHFVAFLWQNDGAGMRPVATFPAGIDSHATGINDAGQIIGYTSAGDETEPRLFLITDGQVTYLDELLPAGSGWTLHSATSINNAGQIVGRGTNPQDKAHGFLLTPYTPPPPTPTLTAAAPVMKITGAKKLTTTKPKLTIKGKATGQVTSVTYRLGSRPAKRAHGTAAWKFQAALKPGKNTLTVTAHGPGGDSAPARLTIIRKP